MMFHYFKRYFSVLKSSFYGSDLYRYVSFLVLSVILGILAGLGAVFFHRLLDGMEYILEPGRLSSSFTYLLAVMPLIGGIITSTMSLLYNDIAAKRGVTSVIKSVLLSNGFIPFKETLFHLFAPIVSIGTGAPLGPEGPAARIGGGIGSYMSQKFSVGPAEMKMYTAAGAGAAISAIFNAPIAGVFFGIEAILLNDIRNKMLGGFIISSVVANVVSHICMGSGHVLAIPGFSIPSPAYFPVFLVFGLGCGMISLLYFSISGFFSYMFTEKLRVKNPYLRLLPVCLVFGIILTRYHELFGIGYSAINSVIGCEIHAGRVIVLLALKIVFVALFLTAGAFGGIFAPALSIGVFSGFIFSHGINRFFNLASDPVLFALTGMGGVLAGINSIPLTSLMLVFEMTNEYRIVLPLMLVTVISHLFVICFRKSSVYELELRGEGINVNLYVDYNILSRIKAGALMKESYDSINRSLPFRKILPLLVNSEYNEVIVLNNNGELEGIISIKNIRHLLVNDDLADLLIALDLASPAPSVTVEESLSSAIRKIDDCDIENIPVVDSKEKKKVIGVISRRDILRAYNKLLDGDGDADNE